MPSRPERKGKLWTATAFQVLSYCPRTLARIARLVIPGVAHHVTPRGNARQFILERDAGRMVYLDLLRRAVEEHNLRVVGYCPMSNHLHGVAVPGRLAGGA